MTESSENTVNDIGNLFTYKHRAIAAERLRACAESFHFGVGKLDEAAALKIVDMIVGLNVVQISEPRNIHHAEHEPEPRRR